jgi:hypothetical protein
MTIDRGTATASLSVAVSGVQRQARPDGRDDRPRDVRGRGEMAPLVEIGEVMVVAVRPNVRPFG